MTTSELVDGQLLADHEITSVAGTGGMGVVYKATQRSLGRTVALKVIRDEIASAPEYRERFLREARLAASVDHPNVVQVYDVGEDEGHLWLAMQWVDGHDLGSVIANFGPRSPERAVAITCQIASALDAVHGAGLIHRDVKPANVLIRDVDNRDHAYLTDFGVAKPPDRGADQLTRTGSVVGTTGYLSPEQIKGAEPGPRSDLYALGCVFFETLTGKPPFSGDNELSVRWAHANDPRPRVPDVRPDLDSRYDAFLARALAVDPRDRFRSGRELAEALQAAHVATPAGAIPTTPLVAPHAATAVGPPTPLPPPGATPLPQGQMYPSYGYVTPAPAYQPPSRGGNPLALVLLGLVALAGIGVGALAATGVFSSKTRTHTITSTQAAHRAKTTATRAPTHKPQPKQVTPPPSSATTSCGGDLSVGPITSCPFAQNVEQAYDQSSGGTTDVTASSPVTGQTYVMHCTGGIPHVCTGGRNASVYFTSGPSSGSSPSQSPTQSPGTPALPSPPSDLRACDQNISANSVTSCPFAENVFKSYADNYQSNGEQSSVTVSASSPATSQSYTMNCLTDGTTVACTGGNNAFVTFPMHAVQVY